MLFWAHVFLLCSTIADDVAASVQCRKTMARIKYVINERHGSANSGYISSGFWGGLTVGRIALLWFTKKAGFTIFRTSFRNLRLTPPQVCAWRVIFLYVLVVLGCVLVPFA